MSSEESALVSHVAPSAPLVCAVVLNYGTWQYSQDCIASLVAMNYPALVIALVDNCSPNESVKHLADYLNSHQGNQPLVYILDTAVRTYTLGNAEVALIESATNDGYAAGINVGLRWGLEQTEAAYFWVLNNDTTFHVDALGALIRQYSQTTATQQGIMGSVLMHYDKPTVVQAIGGRHIPWLGISAPVGEGLPAATAALSKLLPDVNYIIGAACLLSRQTLLRVGFMPDDYFLYYEDTAWSLEAERRGFANTCCLGSLVYHREGGSTRATAGRLSVRGEYYFARNKIRFTRRYFPHYVPFMILSAITAIVMRAWAGNFTAVKTIGSATWNELIHRKKQAAVD
ncbi:glycosyltransferase family 2 protein [Fibrella arboris]|uniref:glycosyltransferase family 2 protein n=1 Tax=Fibrella arboris TaxID=3242486 RepID=UPI0035206397